MSLNVTLRRLEELHQVCITTLNSTNVSIRVFNILIYSIMRLATGSVSLKRPDAEPSTSDVG